MSRRSARASQRSRPDPAGRTVTSLWATGGVDGRFDLYVDDAEGNTRGRARRRRRPACCARAVPATGLIPTAATLHQTLFAGDRGKIIVGLSGLVLLDVIVHRARARVARAREAVAPALLPRGARPGAARRYAWHRAAGLWLGRARAGDRLGAGVLLTFESSLAGWLGTDEHRRNSRACAALGVRRRSAPRARLRDRARRSSRVGT